MYTVPPYDILHGANDASHFLSIAQRRRSEPTPLCDFFEETKDKRKWSLINPGSMLAISYMYFVFGYERGHLSGFSLIPFLERVTVQYPGYESKTPAEKSDFLKRRLRNAIAHCRYEVQIRTDDGRPRNDSDFWMVFQDQRRSGADVVTFEMTLPTFGNLTEDAGCFCAQRAKGAYPDTS